MKIKVEESQAKVNSAIEKLEEVKSWFDNNWDNIEEEGQCCWENFVENIKDII